MQLRQANMKAEPVSVMELSSSGSGERTHDGHRIGIAPMGKYRLEA
jgi:hypothetical protein